MKKLISAFFGFFLLMITCPDSSGQQAANSQIDESTTFELKNDTLFSSSGLKFFIGQQLVVGEPAADGYFRSIIHESAALVPSIWGQDRRYPYAIENHVNKKKSREKAKANVVPGNIITIRKIGYSKTAKPYFYFASFTAGKENFTCDIKLAFILKELSLQQ